MSCRRIFTASSFWLSRKFYRAIPRILNSARTYYRPSLALPSSIFAATVLYAAETSKNMAEEIAKAEEIYAQNKFQEVYEYLLQFKDSENPDILWRLVRATRDRATMAGVSADDKKKMIFEGFEVSKRALEFGDSVGACHKWYGIMLSQTGDFIGKKKKIEDSPAMKKHFEKAAELDPKDPTARHLIGMWCFSFADLAWYERKIAAVVFGSPPESTYEEALGHFEKAEELSPSFYSTNQFMLGLVNMKMGKKEEAKKWFQTLLDFKVIKEDDKENIKKAEGHLKSL